MRAWFENLAPRERIVLAVGAVLAVLIVFWGLVWQPLTDGAEELREQVARKSRLQIDVQRAAAVEPDAEQADAAAGSGQSLVLLVDGTAQTHGLSGALTRTQPEGPDGINVAFRDASFDALVSWLVELWSEHGVRVETASVNGGREPGIVNGQILLRR